MTDGLSSDRTKSEAERSGMEVSVSRGKGWWGMFLVVCIALALTFGFTLLITEVAIGRRTKVS